MQNETGRLPYPESFPFLFLHESKFVIPSHPEPKGVQVEAGLSQSIPESSQVWEDFHSERGGWRLLTAEQGMAFLSAAPFSQETHHKGVWKWF